VQSVLYLAIGTGLVAIGMVLGAFATSPAGQETIRDPVTLMPQYYAVRLENDRVRVLEYRLGPGAKEVLHSHSPGVVYVMADASFRSTSPEGATSVSSRKAGEIFWRESSTHTAENIGGTEAHGLSIELKPCR
jgi:beta-alanine degradation protein BauB